ncbi:MAG: hypothetical protein WDN10_00630 [bacterium]
MSHASVNEGNKASVPSGKLSDIIFAIVFGIVLVIIADNLVVEPLFNFFTSERPVTSPVCDDPDDSSVYCYPHKWWQVW